LHALRDVGRFVFGIAIQDFLGGCSMRDLADNRRDGNPHSSNTCPAAHDLRIERNAIKR